LVTCLNLYSEQVEAEYKSRCPMAELTS
jgi:hypothetical protein